MSKTEARSSNHLSIWLFYPIISVESNCNIRVYLSRPLGLCSTSIHSVYAVRVPSLRHCCQGTGFSLINIDLTNSRDGRVCLEESCAHQGERLGKKSSTCLFPGTSVCQACTCVGCIEALSLLNSSEGIRESLAALAWDSTHTCRGFVMYIEFQRTF